MSINRLLLPAWVVVNTLVGTSLVSPDGPLVPASQGAMPSPYFGQPLPTIVPERFAPGVVSTDDAIELNGVFAPDLKEFFSEVVTSSSRSGAMVADGASPAATLRSSPRR